MGCTKSLQWHHTEQLPGLRIEGLRVLRIDGLRVLGCAVDSVQCSAKLCPVPVDLVIAGVGLRMV